MPPVDLLLIGIGTGNPDHLTRQAVAAISSADLVLVPRKGPDKADLAEIREAILAGILPAGSARIAAFDMPVREAKAPYGDAVDRWHDAIAARWLGAIEAALPMGGTVALLVWGDPSLYDSTLRIAERLMPSPIRSIRVVPGITALQALAAAHAIPLNGIGEPFTVTTGRQVRAHGWPEGCRTLAIMLDDGTALDALDPEGLTIWWGAYLGMPNEIIDHGALGEVRERIAMRRAEARAAHGWIMDVTLIRRD
jgi:precorrin-6A synthase